MHSLRRSFVAVVALALLSGVAAFAADVYKVDPGHSSLVFRAKHLDTAWVYGRFDSFAGTVTTDEDPTKMAFEVVAQVDSINTGQPKRDTHLKSADFFSAKEFPQVRFKSTAVKPAGENKFEVTGDMTLHGQTKPVTVTIERTGASQNPQFGDRVGWLTTFTVKRSEFGMSGMTNMVSDDVEITASFETSKPK